MMIMMIDVQLQQQLQMKKCFGCLRRIKFMLRAKKQNKKWLSYIESYYSHHSKFQWCQLIMEYFDQIRKYSNPSEETLKELRSTNISSEIIKVIRREYELKYTPLTLLVDIFASYATHKYLDVVNPSQVTVTKVSADVQNFVDFMRSLIVIYYGLEERELIGDDQFFRVTLSNFIVECLFLREEFNSCVIQVVKSSCKEAQDRIAFNMQKFKNYSIQQYQINAKYTLDMQTLKLFDCQNKVINQKPFAGPIKIVKQIVKARTPSQKTKCAENLISQVQFSIVKFYEDNKINQPINLDADNAIAILIYILVQSEQSQLLTHLNIIYNFFNKQSLQGSSRFCLDTLKACLQFLQKGSIKRSKGLNIEQSEFSLWINARSYFEQISNK